MLIARVVWSCRFKARTITSWRGKREPWIHLCAIQGASWGAALSAPASTQPKILFCLAFGAGHAETRRYFFFCFLYLQGCFRGTTCCRNKRKSVRRGKQRWTLQLLLQHVQKLGAIALGHRAALFPVWHRWRDLGHVGFVLNLIHPPYASENSHSL